MDLAEDYLICLRYFVPRFQLDVLNLISTNIHTDKSNTKVSREDDSP